MHDVRSDSARDHTVDKSGRVTGVHLTVHDLPTSPFKATLVSVLGEDRSGGQTVARIKVVDDSGSGLRPVLFTGYRGNTESFDEMIEVNGYVAVIASKFDPPNLGPLAIGLVDQYGRMQSDLVGSLGLPWGRHVSFDIEFVRRDEVELRGPISSATANATSNAAGDAVISSADVVAVLDKLEKDLITARAVMEKYRETFG